MLVSKQRDLEESFDDLSGAALEAMYSPDYLRSVSGENARLERIEELKRRIQAGAYRTDPDRIAEELLLRGDLSKV